MARFNPCCEAFQPASVLADSPRLISDVWSHNLHSEILRISSLLPQYPFVSLDTEFPGVLYRLEGDVPDLLYQSIRVNVNATKVIQVGISLADEKGNAPPGVATWQFNMQFDLRTDDFAQDSIDLLTRAGLNFSEIAKRGISPQDFAADFTISGLVLNEDVRWVTFHGGFDFGYVLKALTNRPLPDSESAFLQELHVYFPYFSDVKQIVRYDERFRGGLSRLADQLSLSRAGNAHQAGSDAVLTLACFFRLQRDFFSGSSPDAVFGVLFGLGAGRNQWSNPLEEVWRRQQAARFEVPISN